MIWQFMSIGAACSVFIGVVIRAHSISCIGGPLSNPQRELLKKPWRHIIDCPERKFL